MPAKSKAQQRFMGMVHAAQKGELDNPSAEVEKAADSMSDADAKDYASTKHKGLPNHVKKENMEKELKEIIRQTYRESLRESINEAKIQPKDDWGVRLVVAINNNVSALHTSVIREKKDVQQAVEAFGNVLKNAIKETLKHKYNPHPKYTEADSKIKTFISELKKFENIVDMVISKPTKSGIIKLNDAWRSIWNHKFGAAIALSGDLFNSIVENESVNETISHEAMGIASMTNTRKEAVQKFIDDNNLNAKEILNHVTKGKLPERIRFVQALVGTPNNSSFKWYVKTYANESVNEGKKVFKVNPGIGSSKYSISSHDGVKKHKDGSDFYDIEIFKNKVDLEKGIKKYSSNGFVKESINESDEPSDIIKDLDKLRNELIKKVEVLIAKKKKLYSNVDITTPMSADEKQLDKDIQSIFSEIQSIIQQKRKINK